jgi:hypothetical protein
MKNMAMLTVVQRVIVRRALRILRDPETRLVKGNLFGENGMHTNEALRTHAKNMCVVGSFFRSAYELGFPITGVNDDSLVWDIEEAITDFMKTTMKLPVTENSLIGFNDGGATKEDVIQVLESALA